MMRRQLIISFLLCSWPVLLPAQLNRGGAPLALTAIQLRSEHMYVLPDLSRDLSRRHANRTGQRMKSMVFAHSVDVSVSPETAGTWTSHPSGYDIWHLRVRSEGALSLAVIFDRYRLREGVRLYLYNKDRTHILGALTHMNNKPFGSLAVSHLPGDELVIQMEVPTILDKNYGALRTGSVAHAFEPVFLHGSDPDRFGRSGSCNVDINCEEDADLLLVKRSVCRVIVNGQQLCTGSLLNNVRRDSTPYIYLAGHCFTQRFKPEDAIFYFGYESPACRGGDGPTHYTISGCSILADADSLDFALVELSEAIPDSFQAYYAGWNRSPEPALHTATIHHPRGDVKKISKDLDPPEVSYHTENYYPQYILYSHWRILEWDSGTTEVGSSGGPLFDQDYRMVGSLTGGEADCVSKVDDYFTRFDHAWDYYPEPGRQVRHWLDPDDTGVMHLDGLDPVYNGIAEHPTAASLNVYPNPGQDAFYIDPSGHTPAGAVLSVFDLTGRLVLERALGAEPGVRISLEGEAPGPYLFVLTSAREQVSRLVIKQ